MHVLADAEDMDINVYIDFGGDNYPIGKADESEYTWGFVIGEVEE